MSFWQKLVLFPIIFLWGITLGFSLQNIDNFPTSTRIHTASGTNSDIFNSSKIKEAKKIIETQYYHFSEKSKEEIENGMIESMVRSLGDKHSSYFPPKEAEEFTNLLSGDFQGIGAVIDNDIQWIRVKKVFPTSPAQKAGIQDGDIFTRVGGISMEGVDVEDAVKKIRGPKGSEVVIEYIRPPSNVKKNITVTRDTIIIPSTQEKVLTGGIGYLEVAFFGDHTTDEFQKSIQNLTQSGVQGIILDFRNNGGGFLDTAVDLLGFFLPENSKAVTTRENNARLDHTFYTRTMKIPHTRVPIVMLVNELSASATEIVAGALQDHGRAIIVGTKTYGKGSVQTPFFLEDNSIIKITIGKWYTPKDRGIDGAGITPDITSTLTDEDYQKKNDQQLEDAKKIIQSLVQKQGNIPAVISLYSKK